MKNILSIITKTLITVIYLVVFILLSYYVYKLNIIPTKYLIITYGLVLISTILLIYCLFKTRLLTQILAGVILILITIILTIVTYYLNNTYHFLTRMLVKYDTLSYSVIVKNSSNYNKVDDLKNKSIAYIKDDYSNDLKNKLNKKINYNEITTSDFTKLYEILNKNEVDAIILEESYINMAQDEENFLDNNRVIYTFTIKVKAHKEETNINISNEPFIIYISGIDQYGSVNSVRGRSDVNQLLVINPNTHNILIVNTPRDYYVQLSGTTGLRDKLTHAGIYGIDRSIATIESIYDIDIDHYIRINFDTLISVVDVIGGIDIYSDKSFRPWTNNKVYINEGWNHLNGEEALAYARERKTYVDGDHHRGRNQQQIIEAIINKLTTTSTFLSKYNSILNSLDNTFQTDMDISTITSFIKYQLDKMPNWQIDSVQAYGYASWNYTYSMGYNYYLWVMEPDWNSINKIKEKIKGVMQEN